MPDGTARNRTEGLPLLSGAAIVVATVLIMKVEGRLWWCTCGEFYLGTWSGWSSHTSQHLFDPYSLTHVSHGFIFWWLIALFPRFSNARWQLAAAIGIEALWEVVENSSLVIERYRKATAALGYSGDTIANSLADVLCCTIGFLLARRFGFRVTLAAMIAMETALLFWIRNGLLLETLMLIAPIESVKLWQLNH